MFQPKTQRKKKAAMNFVDHDVWPRKQLNMRYHRHGACMQNWFNPLSTFDE